MANPFQNRILIICRQLYNGTVEYHISAVITGNIFDVKSVKLILIKSKISVNLFTGSIKECNIKSAFIYSVTGYTAVVNVNAILELISVVRRSRISHSFLRNEKSLFIKHKILISYLYPYTPIRIVL